MFSNHLSQPASLSVGAARLYELLLDAYQLDRHILGCYAHDSPDILVAHILQPQQDERPIHHAELVDAGVELADLLAVLVRVGKEVARHREGHTLTPSPLLALCGETGVQRHTPHPGVRLRLSAKPVKAQPKIDERILEKVLHLVMVLGEHIAHRVYRALMLADYLFKFSFLVFHLQK